MIWDLIIATSFLTFIYNILARPLNKLYKHFTVTDDFEKRVLNIVTFPLTLEEHEIEHKRSENAIFSNETGIVPTKSEKDAAGYDLYSPGDFYICSKETVTVFLNIKIDYPNNVYGQIHSRSGLASKSEVIALAGVCDPYYSGNIGVILRNNNNTVIHIKKKQRIAQMIFTRFESFPIKTITEDEYTLYRNSKETKKDGFGSSGL